MPVPASQCTNQAIWNPLRQAIAESSGFRAWQQELEQSQTDDRKSNERLDGLVHRYLEETLSTLAY
jgi:hypothetical protein